MNAGDTVVLGGGKFADGAVIGALAYSIGHGVNAATKANASTSAGTGDEEFQGPRSEEERVEINEKMEALRVEGGSVEGDWQAQAQWGKTQALKLQSDYGYEFGFTLRGSETNSTFGKFYTSFNSQNLPAIDRAEGWFRLHTHPISPSHSGDDMEVARQRVKYGLKYSVVASPNGSYIYDPVSNVNNYPSALRPMFQDEFQKSWK